MDSALLAGWLQPGPLTVEKANRRATSLLLSYSQQFREHLDSLTGGEKARLSDLVSDILRAIGL
jgi:hypothetical protein